MKHPKWPFEDLKPSAENILIVYQWQAAIIGSFPQHDRETVNNDPIPMHYFQTDDLSSF
jgi:hypothetical protein